MSDTHKFELIHDIELAATPEQVWAAIASGPGRDSWFMGRNVIEPRLGGAARMAMPGFDAISTITAFEPSRRFAFQGEPEPDGTFMAFEYLIEGRDGATSLRMVHSGLLGQDWEAEYDALQKGNPLYLRSLGEYLRHFAGRVGVPVTLFGPRQSDQDHVWTTITRGVGLSSEVNEGDRVAFTVAGQKVEGVVDVRLEPSFLGLRTEDALLRFVGRYGVILTGHHIFDDIDAALAEKAWNDWLITIFS